MVFLQNIDETLLALKDKIEPFCELLIKYNKVHNISGSKTKNDVLENIKDSIYPIRFLKNNPKSAIDIGTGAGFPGLILGFILPDTNFTLFEPIAKKSSFLHLVKSELNLANITIESKRVEDANKNVVDLITSRAVNDVKFLIKIANGYFDKKTTFIFYKGTNVENEISNLKNVRIFERKLRKYVFIEGLKEND